MIELSDLWLPILLSAVFVFIASSILHMALPIHKGDYKKLPTEDRVLEAMRNEGVAVGTYMFPCPDSMKDMGSPEMLEKYGRGPVGFMTILPNSAPAIGKSLIQWFFYSVLIGLFVAYVAKLGLTHEAGYSAVFRMTGAVALLAYAVAYFPDSIWKGQPWSNTLKFMFDGAIYGLVTAATFAWLWPDGA